MIDLPVWVEITAAFMAFIQFLLLVFILPLRGAIDRLKEADDQLKEKLAQWQYEVASNYTRKDEVAAQHRELLQAIHRLEGGITQLGKDKVDK